MGGPRPSVGVGGGGKVKTLTPFDSKGLAFHTYTTFTKFTKFIRDAPWLRRPPPPGGAHFAGEAIRGLWRIFFLTFSEQVGGNFFVLANLGWEDGLGLCPIEGELAK